MENAKAAQPPPTGPDSADDEVDEARDDRELLGVLQRAEQQLVRRDLWWDVGTCHY
jgi:hypothetical protein